MPLRSPGWSRPLGLQESDQSPGNALIGLNGLRSSTIRAVGPTTGQPTSGGTECGCALGAGRVGMQEKTRRAPPGAAQAAGLIPSPQRPRVAIAFLAIPENWKSYFCNVNDEFSSIAMDVALQLFALRRCLRLSDTFRATRESAIPLLASS